MRLNTGLLTLLATVAFAANSLLCRAALDSGATDAGTFTALRLVSGAAFLLPLLLLGPRRRRPSARPAMALALLVYMLSFSLAYRSLTAATGALVLFGAVQLTMFARALAAGERLALRGWLGLALALGGLVGLLLPGVEAPDPVGAALMALAGIAWGAYSLLGRGSDDPLADTAGNFALAAPVALLALPGFPLLAGTPLAVSTGGVVLAVASGAIASGLGYVLWYAALRGLEAHRAATVQLSVPVIAALGGVLLLGESLDRRLLVAGSITLAGIWLALDSGGPRRRRP